MQHIDQTQFDQIRSLAAAQGADVPDIIDGFLRAARTHLGLQVAYVSEFVGNDAVYHHVDAPGLEALIKPGDRRSLDDVYCRHILAGRLPELIPDTACEPLAMALPITTAVPIGAHVSVPLRRADNSVFGMFCCLGPAADASLNPRDLGMVRTFADLAADELKRRHAAAAEIEAIRAPVADMIASGGPDIVFQPIFRVSETRPAGFEALSRFSSANGAPPRGPDRWFADAARVGLAEPLELAAVKRALALLPCLPAEAYLTVNVSPATATSPLLAAALVQAGPERLVLEITEQQEADDVDTLLASLAPLRAAGLRLAVDDAGAGYSGLQKILLLRPDIIKLDRFFVNGIDHDPSRRALTLALVAFAHQMQAELIAEGVETDAERATLEALGVAKLQGWLLGRPQPIDKIALMG
jgi:EAL domain-containing protein (putative c-di-GMP-specific phosphodiesterase class I)